MAKLVSSWSSCLNRKVGAVIVKDKCVLTTGYNGAPHGIKSCKDKNECLRKNLCVESGTRLEVGYAVHAEQNAIIQAAKFGLSVQGATIYCTHQPCTICAKMIINSGLVRVVYLHGYPNQFSLDLFDEAGVTIQKLEL